MPWWQTQRKHFFLFPVADMTLCVCYRAKALTWNLGNYPHRCKLLSSIVCLQNYFKHSSAVCWGMDQQHPPSMCFLFLLHQMRPTHSHREGHVKIQRPKDFATGMAVSLINARPKVIRQSDIVITLNSTKKISLPNKNSHSSTNKGIYPLHSHAVSVIFTWLSFGCVVFFPFLAFKMRNWGINVCRKLVNHSDKLTEK